MPAHLTWPIWPGTWSRRLGAGDFGLWTAIGAVTGSW